MKRKKLTWVCAFGKHQNIWDFAITGNFEDCLDYVWGTLQHETNLQKNQFKSKLKVNRGYIGKYAEIKQLPSKMQLSTGIDIAHFLIIFDEPEKINLGLSRPVYAAIRPGCPDIIFANYVYQGLDQEKINNQLKTWQNLKVVGVDFDDINTIVLDSETWGVDIQLLRLTNYPIIVTTSPFILAKAYCEGLIACFVPSLISLVSNSKNGEQEGILKDLCDWISPCPKNIYLVEENLKKVDEDYIYEEIPGYEKILKNTLFNLQAQCYKLSSSVNYFSVDYNIKGSELVKIIRQKEQSSFSSLRIA